MLTVLVIDKGYSTIRSRGNLDLRPWTPPNEHFVSLSFICGYEEICLLDSSMTGRIFSLVTEQFKQVSLVSRCALHAERLSLLAGPLPFLIARQSTDSTVLLTGPA